VLTAIDYRHLLNRTLATSIETSGKTSVIREEIMAEAGMPKRQATELALGILYGMCASLLGEQWHPRNVSFSHSMLAERQDYRRVFACRLQFDAEFDGIVCNTSDLDLPNPRADPAMASYARRFMDSMAETHLESVIFDVRKAIYLLMPVGRATVEQTAQGLGVSVRTLQRNLDEAGVTFSELLSGVRRELALRYVENRKYSMQRVGMLLGYAVQSSFTRWFCTEFGASPRAWRKQLLSSRSP
jgi:AraC-like DNA-binding protein